MNAPNSSDATAALVLGILGFVLCPLCAPAAWAFGTRAQREIDASGGALAGRGLATAGKVLGIIGTVFLTLFAVGLLLFGIGVFAESGST